MYELNRLGENTYYINSPTNIGLYENGGRVCLIDSGNDKDAGKKALRLIEGEGWKLETVINTHSHADHIGGNALLQSRTGCKILAPGEDCCYTNFPSLEPAFLFGGFPYKELENKFFRAAASRALPLEESVLPEGIKTERFDGHSYAQTAVGTGDGVWFLGDTLVGADTLEKYHISYVYDVKEYLESLRRVKKLGGKLFIPSHADPQEDISPLADVNIKNTLEIAERIRDILKDPQTLEDTVSAVFAAYGLIINHIQYTLVSCTVRSYVSYLYNLGEIVCEFRGNKLYWLTKS